MPLQLNAFTGTLDYTASGTSGGAVTGTGSAGQVAFWTGASNLSGDNAFEWDNVNKRVGIGIVTGILAQLHTLLDVAAGGNSQHALFDQYNASNVTGPLVIGRRSRGTPSVPAAVIAGDQLLNVNARGDDSSGFVAGNRVNILLLAGGAPAAAWTGASNPTRIDFNTTDVGSTSVSSGTPRLRIDDDGSILVNTTGKIAGSKVVITGGALHVLAGNALRLQGAGAGFTSFVDPTHAANIAYTLPAAQAAIAGQVLTNDATGLLSWTSPGSNPTGPAGGDLSGAYPNPTVAKINGALLGTTTPLVQGDLLVADATPSFARFAGNATATREYLSMTSSVPLWTAIPGTDVTGAALTTGAADPNVTIALGGAPATALLRAASITLGWSGQLAVGRGGTGLASGTSGGILGFTGTTTLASSALLTANALVLGGGAGATPTTPVGLGTTTTVLHGNAAGPPSFGAVVLGAGGDVTGLLPIANGGTGQGNAAAAFNGLSPLTTEGDLLTFTGGNNARLPLGTINQKYLRNNGTDPVWVDPTLFDDFTQYLKLSGRAGITNNALLSTSGVGGTLSGSNQAGGQLFLQGSTNGAGAGVAAIPQIHIGANTTNVGPNIGSFLSADPALTFNSSGGRVFAFEVGTSRAIPVTWTVSAAAYGGVNLLFYMAPVITNPTGIVRGLGSWSLLVNQVQFQADGANTSVADVTTVNEQWITNPIAPGVVTIQNAVTVNCTPGLAPGDVVILRRGLVYGDAAGGGGVATQGTSIALDVLNQTSAAAFTEAAALRSAMTDAATKFFLHDTGGARSEFVGKFTRYNNVPTAGWGIPGVNGFGRSTAQTAAVASVAAYTLPAADGTVLVSANVLVTTSTTHNFNVQVAYTDEGNTPRTVTMNVQQLAGTFVTAITNLTGVGPYEGIPLHLRCKASTTVTVKTTGTFTAVTYNVEGVIVQVA